MEGFLLQEMIGTGGTCTPALGVARAIFRSIGTGFIYKWIRDRAIDYLLGGKVVQDVRLETLESLCGRLGVKRIDFLKIDCERAEMDVLMGIGASQWNDIESIAMEVHNNEDEKGGNSLDRIITLLESKGFTIGVDQPLTSTNLYMLYARRGAGTVRA